MSFMCARAVVCNVQKYLLVHSEHRYRATFFFYLEVYLIPPKICTSAIASTINHSPNKQIHVFSRFSFSCSMGFEFSEEIWSRTYVGHCVLNDTNSYDLCGEWIKERQL